MRRHLLLSALALVACSRGKTHAFEDTEGRKFSWECRGARCDLQDRVTSSNATPNPSGSPGIPGSTAEFTVPYNANDRYVTACDAWVSRAKDGASSGHDSHTCRIVTCKVDADCPPEVSIPQPTCMNGLCGDPKRQLTQTDYMHLCLAGTGAWTASPTQLAREQLADRASRPTLQPVPAECRQP